MSADLGVLSSNESFSICTSNKKWCIQVDVFLRKDGSELQMSLEKRGLVEEKLVYTKVLYARVLVKEEIEIEIETSFDLFVFSGDEW